MRTLILAVFAAAMAITILQKTPGVRAATLPVDACALVSLAEVRSIVAADVAMQSRGFMCIFAEQHDRPALGGTIILYTKQTMPAIAQMEARSKAQLSCGACEQALLSGSPRQLLNVIAGMPGAFKCQPSVVDSGAEACVIDAQRGYWVLKHGALVNIMVGRTDPDDKTQPLVAQELILARKIVTRL